MIHAQTTNINTVQCHCDKEGQIGAKNNGYTCGSYHAYCPNETMSCDTKAGNLIHQDTAVGRGGGTITKYVGVECQLGTASNGKKAIECICDKPNSSGQNTEIKCTNNLTHEVQAKDCGTDKVCATGPNLVHVSFGENISGADCQETCKCDGTKGVAGTHGKAGQGNNSWTCADKSKSGSCGNLEDYCQNNPASPGGVECINSSTCTCKDKNTVHCSAGAGVKNQQGQPDEQDFDCGSKVCVKGDQYSHDFANQQVKGADCQPVVPPTLPPPPSPPCLTWNNGVCLTFGSTFGAFSTSPSGFIEKIFAVLLSVSGGIALLLIIKAGYQMMTAQGNPEKLNNAREQLVAAIVGLVFLIFSFVFLQLIGFDILKIPGFGPGGGSANNNVPMCAPGSCFDTKLCQAKNGHCNSNGCPSGQSCSQY